MRFAVESWSPEFGTATSDEALVEGTISVDAWVESGVDQWAPRSVPSSTELIHDLLFVDGVRRIEAHVWITGSDDVVVQGICASYAAGAVRCNGEATVVAREVRRGLFSPAKGAEPIDTRHAHFALHVCSDDMFESLSLALQKKMGELESQVATQAGPAEIVIVDGPLRQKQTQSGFVGFVKTHRVSYGPAIVRETVTGLGVGERTPLLVIDSRGRRYTWYMRLPCRVSHGWAGIVRLEIPAEQPVAEAIALADRLCATLPRFASKSHKDSRAPQNLYPIGGLERDLRRRLGDPSLIVRSLHESANTTILR